MAASPRPASLPSTSASTQTGPSSMTWAASTGSPCCASSYESQQILSRIYLFNHLLFSFNAIRKANNKSPAMSIKSIMVVIACKAAQRC